MNTGKGWGIPGKFNVNTENVDTIVCGVCTCRWHKEQCVGQKKCEKLFGQDGYEGIFRTLKRLMGKSYPKSWGTRWSCSESSHIWEARTKKMTELEREAFKACRPVKVTIEVRK